MAEQWDLLFSLPNLSPPIPSPFESDGFVICSGRDPRLKKLAASAGNTTARRMLNSFRTHRGARYKPGCFLIRTNVAKALRDAEVIRAFRNICSISTITAAYALSLDSPDAGQWRVFWGDQFVFGYFTAGHSGAVLTLSGASLGMDNKIPRQQPDAQFSNPTSWSILVDEPLLDRLLRCWRRCYLQNRDRKKLLRLFRSLEVAFHASQFPADGMTSINDIGTRLALWVSAFEVLCHPGGSVNKRIVQTTVRNAPFTLRALAAKRYTISFQGKKIRVTLPEALYDDLYWARNQFLHGMPVRRSMLQYRQSKQYAELTDVAPVLFNAALVSRLNSLGVAGGPMDFDKVTPTTLVKYMKTHRGIQRVQEGIIAARDPV
jgi:hypothetical protein